MTFGWTAADAIGRSLSETIIPPQYRERHARGMAHLLATGEGPILNRRIEITALHRDGREFPVELTVTPVRIGDDWHFTAFLRDVTERKSADDALRAANERFNLVARATNDAVWDWDLIGRTVWWNEAFEALYGCGPADIEANAESWRSRIHADDRDRVWHGINAVIEHGGTTWADEYRFSRADGTYADVFDRGSVIRDDAGRAIRMVGAMMDLTLRRHLEAQLRQAQRIDAVGQLAGGIAHDFNNLLTTILGSADLLLELLPPDHPGREEAHECRKAAMRAAELTRQLLAFSRRQVLAPRVLHLNDVVADMDKMLRRLIGEHIDLRTALAHDLGAVRADPGQLEQVVVNLVVNARDAMSSGGNLTIATANADLTEAGGGAETLMAPGAYVVLSVSDTGTGMDAETQARMFEPFFTTKPTGKGTGLGLATVFGIVKQSGGYIQVASALGRGTTFTIHLPRVDGTTSQLHVASTAAMSVGGAETVLLVEDQEEVRTLTHKILKARGYEVLLAAGGPEALSVAAQHGSAIHLLVTDVVMPGMSGGELSRQLSLAQPAMKVLFISGHPDSSILHDGELDPSVAFLQKPFSAHELARRVREVLDTPGDPAS